MVMPLYHTHLPTALIGILLMSMILGTSTSTVQAQTSERVELEAGCNRVVLTWPEGVMLRDVVEAITPVESVEAIWMQVPGADTYLAYAPDAPQRVSGLRAASYLDTVQICMETAGVLTRPLG
jgi:hypothetical protein